MKDKLPPQNLEAEVNILGCLMIDKDAISKIADTLTPDDFYSDANSTIYESMLSLYEKRVPIDIVSLANILGEQGKLELIGGRTFLIEITQQVLTSAHLLSYTDIIIKKATLRRMLNVSSKIAELSFEEEKDIQEIIDEAESSLFNVSRQATGNEFTAISSVLDGAFARIDDLSQNKGKLRGVPTGFTDLDNLLSGLQNSDLVILAARPSVGKTAFALNIAKQAALNAKKPVALFSLEMAKEQLVDRLICSESGIDLWKMRTGNLSDDNENNDYAKIGGAIGKLSESPLYIDDSGMLNVMQIRTKCRRLKMEKGLGLIVIDYLQLVSGLGTRKNDARYQEVSDISRSLKALAKELDVPILALSQLSRAVEMSKPSIPKLAHLRESGSIEQDADVVMFIYRKAADKNYRPEELSAEDKNVAEIHVSKHRNGPCGIVNLYFDQHTTTFKNLASNIQVEELEI
ncbi:replicative DNA helicase [Patescibacteria group bacterium]|nr:replicative DNA helicase [Patescibacteria group bacterium]